MKKISVISFCRKDEIQTLLFEVQKRKEYGCHENHRKRVVEMVEEWRRGNREAEEK
jgi:hypothetical protein